MRKFLFWNSERSRAAGRPMGSFLPVSRLMLVLFTAGVVSGALVGTYASASGLPSAMEAYLSADTVPRSLLLALWNAGKYFLLLFAASTSWLGVLLAPTAVLLRGYLFSCSVSALFSAYSWDGLRSSALISGIPALLLIPCFLIAACDSFSASRRLLSLRFDRGVGVGPPAPARRAAAALMVIVIDALYSFYLLPGLLAGV